MFSQTFAKDHEIQAEDEQVFLNKQLGLLNQSANQQSAIGIPRQDSVMRSLTGVTKSGDRRTSLTSQVPGSPTKKVSSLFIFVLGYYLTMHISYRLIQQNHQTHQLLVKEYWQIFLIPY